MTEKLSADQVPERYDCKIGQCKPPTISNSLHWLDVCTFLPNDGMWLWKCPHGRPFYLRWEPSWTTAEFADAIGVTP